MSIFSALFGGTQTLEQAFGAKDITSTGMKEAVKNWYRLYLGQGLTAEADGCQRLPVAIVQKLTKTVFSEYTATVQREGAKSKFVEGLLRELDRVRVTAFQQMLIGGACMIKPVPTGRGFVFVVVPRDRFLTFSRDLRGAVTSVGMMETSLHGEQYYTLLERRSVSNEGILTITNALYTSRNKNELGHPVPLTAIPEYAELKPNFSLPHPVWNLGMATLKSPLMNCVDGSAEGVSVYAPAVGLLENINRNERQLDDEFENGASLLIMSDDMLIRDEEGRKKRRDKLFVSVDDSPENVGVTIFSPNLREQSYLARKNEYLRNLESLIGFKRGILSEIEAAERTATEITSSAGDYNLTIVDFQRVWEAMVRELLATCDLLGQMYGLCDGSPFDPETDFSIDWGDGVLFNRDKAFAEQLQMVQAGLLKPELAVAWYYGLPHETEKDLQLIRARYMPELSQLLGGEV